MAIERAISNTLQGYIDKANSTFGKAKEYVVLAYEQALREGYTPVEAKQLLFEKITVFSDRTIYRYLPDEVKDQKALELNSFKSKPSVTSGTDSLESKPMEEEREITKAEKIEILEKLFVIESNLRRKSLVNDWQRIEFIIKLEPFIQKLHPDIGEHPPLDITSGSKLAENPYKKYYDVMTYYANHWLQSITSHNWFVAAAKHDGSLDCFLCLIDYAYKIEYDDEDEETILIESKKHTAEFMPKIYSNEELAAHFLLYHLSDKAKWKKYQPYLINAERTPQRMKLEEEEKEELS